jgi:hypothetical protein
MKKGSYQREGTNRRGRVKEESKEGKYGLMYFLQQNTSSENGYRIFEPVEITI